MRKHLSKRRPELNYYLLKNWLLPTEDFRPSNIAYGSCDATVGKLGVGSSKDGSAPFLLSKNFPRKISILINGFFDRVLPMPSSMKVYRTATVELFVIGKPHLKIRIPKSCIGQGAILRRSLRGRVVDGVSLPI